MFYSKSPQKLAVTAQWCCQEELDRFSRRKMHSSSQEQAFHTVRNCLQDDILQQFHKSHTWLESLWQTLSRDKECGLYTFSARLCIAMHRSGSTKQAGSSSMHVKATSAHSSAPPSDGTFKTECTTDSSALTTSLRLSAAHVAASSAQK